MFERWKPIKSYEGLYEVSDWGRVKSLNRCVNRKNKGKLPLKCRILKTHRIGDYLGVRLSKDGVTKDFSIHKLVAEAFVPNPENKPCVNHLTECKFFNHFSTLSWATQKENVNFGNGIELQTQKRSKAVLQYTIDGSFIKEWPSVSSIQKELQFSISRISRCCNNKSKKAYGYIWKFAA